MFGQKPASFQDALRAALALFCAIASGTAAQADTTIEITPHPIVIESQRLANTPAAEQAARDQAQALAWVHDYGSSFPVLHATLPTGTSDGSSLPQAQSSDVLASLGEIGNKDLGKLIFNVIHFANDVSSESRSFESDFKAVFLHAINARAPGFAWFVTAERTGFDLGTLAGFREGGGAGVQIPILGSRDLWVKNGEGQLVLRIMPIAGNYEQVEAGPDADHRVAAPGSGLILRPSAETEATYQIGPMKPGLRFLVQPKLLQPNQARMIAEVYVNFDFETGNPYVNKVSIVPRCLIDFSNDAQKFSGTNAQAYAAGYEYLNKAETCSISAEFAFGI
jgi:hypothetical protein